MDKIPYTMTGESISITWKGQVHTVQKGSPNFTRLRNALFEENWEAVQKNLSVGKSIQEWAKGKFTVNEDVISYEGSELPTSLNRRILRMATEGADPTPLFNFFERLQKNPSWRSVQQLWPFLEKENISLTPEGKFLAYKSVRRDYKDVHTGTIDNSPGTTHVMPRNQISDDPKEACHYGFHVGALSYARTFHKDGKMVICEVDPEHVVCVPYDSSQEKMRVCEYKVIGNFGSELPSTIFDAASEDKIDSGELDYSDESDFEDEETADSDDSEFDKEDNETLDEDSESSDGEEAESEEDLKVVPEEMTPESGRRPVTLEPTEKDKKKGLSPKKQSRPPARVKRQFAKYNKMEVDELMNLPISELRFYATHGLLIIGASKIPGGKSALVAHMLKIRE